MRRAVPIFLLILLGALIVGAGAAVRNRTEVTGPTYTIHQVAAGLRGHPTAWVGRTISVSGVVSMNLVSCPSKIHPAPLCDSIYVLTTFPQRGLTDLLILNPHPDQLLNQLRSLPGIGRLLPGPQLLVGAATFRVKLEPSPTSFLCPRQPCYWGELPDAAAPNVGAGLHPFKVSRWSEE